MARLSDQIEEFIKNLFEQESGNFLEIQRNELAYSFKCAPSQINYVLTTRFTLDRGYYVESKRGGGGCIKITWIDIDKDEYIKNAIWNNIGNSLGFHECESYIELFMERGFVTAREAAIMKAVINSKSLTVNEEINNQLRAQLLKTMLITILN
jgi:transcriptional regulator of stress and heat shock response